MNAPQSARLRPFKPVPFGRYTLLTPLSVGGMGEIFLARLEGPQGFEKLCVIKKILPSLARDPEFVERFVNEARTLVKLSHGCIAQVLDMGLHEGDPYIALEYVDGKDLRKVAARARERSMPLPLTFVLYVMGRVLDALAYAHRKRDEEEKEIGLVHRDVSPQNVLISYEGEVKVIDFGLAKSSLNSARTNPSMILGKFLYMSPEQARHQKVDRRADLYAAGLCLYELVSGKNPFDDVPPHELMMQVANPPISPLNQVDPLCPPAVQQMVARALQVDPARRFQTAEEFRAKVMGALLEIDPTAGPESASRYMREAFGQEYGQERKLLGALRSLPRAEVEAAAAEPRAAARVKEDRETAVVALKEVAPDAEAQRALQQGPAPSRAERPTAPRGPIKPSPLSFAPTPRTGEADEAAQLRDQETVPGVVLAEELRQAMMSAELPPSPPPGPVAQGQVKVPGPVTLDGPLAATAAQDGQVSPSLSPVASGPLQPPPPGKVPAFDQLPTLPPMQGEDLPGLADLLAAPPEDTQPRVVVGTLLEEPPEPVADAAPDFRAEPEPVPEAQVASLPTRELLAQAAPEDTQVKRVPRRGAGVFTLAIVVGVLAVAGGAGWFAWSMLGQERAPSLDVLRPGDLKPLAIAPPQGPPTQAPPPQEEEASTAQVPVEEQDLSDIVSLLDADPAEIAKQAAAEAEAGVEALEPAPAPEVKPAAAKATKPKAPVRTRKVTLRDVTKEWTSTRAVVARMEKRLGCTDEEAAVVCGRRTWMAEEMKRASTLDEAGLARVHRELRDLKAEALRVERSR